jgi:two-component system invasion response regulator UvrY
MRSCERIKPVSILIADDHPAMRSGLRSLLALEPGFEVQGDVTSGEAAYAWYRRHRPDVVIMDLSMEGYGGIEAIRRILQFDPGARILVYTVHTSEVMLHRALGLGALGYVTKGSEIDILLQGIREVAGNRGFVSPDMIPAVVRRDVARRVPALEQLGYREFQILLMVAQGQRAADCAQILNLSEKTIRNYLTQIKGKLQVADTAEMIRLAIRAGLMEP